MNQNISPMRILETFASRIEVLAFTMGFLTSVYMLIFFPARYFITWHALPASPVPIEKIISVHMSEVIIKTVSNEKFKCNLGNEKECWTVVQYEPLELGKSECFIVDCPNKKIIQMMRATSLAHSFGEVSNIYSLHNDGVIYVKQTGFVYIEGYIMGAILGGLCALITFIGKRLYQLFTSR